MRCPHAPPAARPEVPDTRLRRASLASLGFRVIYCYIYMYTYIYLYNIYIYIYIYKYVAAGVLPAALRPANPKTLNPKP